MVALTTTKLREPQAKRRDGGRELSNDEWSLAFVVPGDLATPTGGYGHDRRIIQELRRLGWRVYVADIGNGFPFPSKGQRQFAMSILSDVPAGCPTVVDGLAFGALPEAGALRSRTPLIALVHQPLALDPGLDTRQADIFRGSERAALANAARVVVTSEATRRIMMTEYDVSDVGPKLCVLPIALKSPDDNGC